MLIPPHEYFVLEGHRTPPSPEQLRRTVFITAEQPETVHFRQNVAVADRAGALFDISARAVRAYRRLGVRANHLQLGYTPSWDHFAAAEPEEDLIFMGAWTPRRGRVIAGAARRARRAAAGPLRLFRQLPAQHGRLARLPHRR